MLPLQRPLRRVEMNLSRVRSLAISRSNSAKPISVLIASRPSESPLFKCWLTETSDTLCWSKKAKQVSSWASSEV